MWELWLLFISGVSSIALHSKFVLQLEEYFDCPVGSDWYSTLTFLSTEKGEYNIPFPFLVQVCGMNVFAPEDPLSSMSQPTSPV